MNLSEMAFWSTYEGDRIMPEYVLEGGWYPIAWRNHPWHIMKRNLRALQAYLVKA